MSESIVTSTDASEARSTAETPADRPRWVAFGVILGAILVLSVTPAILGAAVPPKPENLVGVYERVTLHSEPDNAGVLGGFIAPQGWMAIEPGDDEDSTEKPQRSFTTQDGGVTMTATVHEPVEDVERLLRHNTPVGATLAPIRRLDSAPLLTADLLEYDLGAGSGINQRIAVCEVLRNNSCLLFEVEVSANHSSADGGPMLPDVAAVIASAEVLPSAGAQS